MPIKDIYFFLMIIVLEIRLNSLSSLDKKVLLNVSHQYELNSEKKRVLIKREHLKWNSIANFHWTN